MNAIDEVGFALLIIAAVLVAPHMAWPEARTFAAIALLCGVFFLAVGGI